MKKYKVKKDFYDYFEKGDIVTDNGMYYEDNIKYSYCSVLDLVFKISKKEILDEFFEEIKEEENLKFKIGDMVVVMGCIYGTIEGYNKNAKQYYITKRQYDNEDNIRLATPQEIELYFSNN